MEHTDQHFTAQHRWEPFQDEQVFVRCHFEEADLREVQLKYPNAHLQILLRIGRESRPHNTLKVLCRRAGPSFKPFNHIG